MSKQIYLLRRLRQTLKPPWLDSTQWHTVVHSALVTENEFVRRPLHEPTDNLARAAACAAVLQTSETLLSRTVAPLRVGKIATDSIETYTKLLHAAAAGHYALQCTSSTNTSNDKMQAAGKAWRHLHAAGTWCHEKENCPPQLKPEFKKTLQTIVLLLADDALHERASTYRIKLLHALVALTEPTSEIHTWAYNDLAEAISVHWALKHYDPRTLTPNPVPNVMLAYAACSAIGDCGNETVSKFVRAAATVGGMTGLPEARQTVNSLGGRAGLLEPPKDAVDRAMPVKLLGKGSTVLSNHSLLQTELLPEGRQPLHAKGPGVVLFIAKVPAVPTTVSASTSTTDATPTSRWWKPSGNFIAMPSFRSSKPSPDPSNSQACSSSDFL